MGFSGDRVGFGLGYDQQDPWWYRINGHMSIMRSIRSMVVYLMVV